ncbi:unnamed protein product [Urochloa humidicola]
MSDKLLHLRASRFVPWRVLLCCGVTVDLPTSTNQCPPARSGCLEIHSSFAVWRKLSKALSDAPAVFGKLTPSQNVKEAQGTLMELLQHREQMRDGPRKLQQHGH